MSADAAKGMRVDVQEIGSAVVVHITGSAGMSEAEHFKITLEDLARKQRPIIVLDLSDMEFISSVGLGAIVSGHLKSRHHHGQIRLVNPQPAVRELLETTRLTKLFPIYETLEQAFSAKP